MSGRSPPLYCTLTSIAMQEHQTKQNKNNVVVHRLQISRLIVIDDNRAIEPYNNKIGAYSLKNKERYDIIIGEEWYICVLQQVPRDF